MISKRLRTSGEKRMPSLCWIYKDDIQQECISINTCATDMLNALPTDKNNSLLTAHSSDYDCRFILECLEILKQIVKGCRFLQIKATYYNPIKRKRIKITIKGTYKSIPVALIESGECFKLAASKEIMPYNIYTYEKINMDACSIQNASDVF